MFEAFVRARIKPRHLVEIFGISRVTASLWLNGKGKPHALLRARVAHVSAAVDAALESGEFPVPEDYKGAESTTYIKAVLRKHLAKEKAATN